MWTGARRRARTRLPHGPTARPRERRQRERRGGSRRARHGMLEAGAHGAAGPRRDESHDEQRGLRRAVDNRPEAATAAAVQPGSRHGDGQGRDQHRTGGGDPRRPAPPAAQRGHRATRGELEPFARGAGDARELGPHCGTPFVATRAPAARDEREQAGGRVDHDRDARGGGDGRRGRDHIRPAEVRRTDERLDRWDPRVVVVGGEPGPDHQGPGNESGEGGAGRNPRRPPHHRTGTCRGRRGARGHALLLRPLPRREPGAATCDRPELRCASARRSSRTCSAPAADSR